MSRVGEEIDGYCSRCRLNVHMIVNAVNGDEVLAVTCRTCRNTVKYKPEISEEARRAKAMKKLMRLRTKDASQTTRSRVKAKVKGQESSPDQSQQEKNQEKDLTALWREKTANEVTC